MFRSENKNISINISMYHRQRHIRLLYIKVIKTVLNILKSFNLYGLEVRKPVFKVYEHRHRPACASTQSDKRLLPFVYAKKHI